jgi:hypothetical protein
MPRRAIAKFCAGVPGWYSTYWVKMLNDIEVLNRLTLVFSACQSAKPRCGTLKVV